MRVTRARTASSARTHSVPSARRSTACNWPSVRTQLDASVKTTTGVASLLYTRCASSQRSARPAATPLARLRRILSRMAPLALLKVPRVQRQIDHATVHAQASKATTTRTIMMLSWLGVDSPLNSCTPWAQSLSEVRLAVCHMMFRRETTFA